MAGTTEKVWLKDIPDGLYRNLIEHVEEVTCKLKLHGSDDVLKGCEECSVKIIWDWLASNSFQNSAGSQVSSASELEKEIAACFPDAEFLLEHKIDDSVKVALDNSTWIIREAAKPYTTRDVIVGYSADEFPKFQAMPWAGAAMRYVNAIVPELKRWLGWFLAER